MSGGRRGVLAATARLAALGATIGVALAVAGCGASESLGLNDLVPRRPAIFDERLTNDASRVEPFVQRLRYPIPDGSWEREAASEFEPWTLRGGTVGSAARARGSAHARRTRLARHARAGGSCRCGAARGRG